MWSVGRWARLGVVVAIAAAYACGGDGNAGANREAGSGSGGSSAAESGTGGDAEASGGSGPDSGGAGAAGPGAGEGGAGAGAGGSSGGAGGASGATGGSDAGTQSMDAGAGDAGAGGAVAGDAGQGQAGMGASGDGGSGATAGSSDAGAEEDGGVDAAGGSGAFPPVDDLEAPGPYADNTVNPSGPNNGYSLFHPQQLAPNGAKNPIIGWGCGGSTDPSWYTLLPHLASHGFVVIASNAIPGIGGEVQQGQDLIAGINWLVEENERQGSEFFGKLNTDKIAAMGYSMGSLATFTIADDPRLVTTVHISGGNMTAGRIDNLRAMAAFFCGDPPATPGDMLIGDVARPNCDTDFEQATVPVFYGNFTGGSHLGVMTSPFMERIRVAVTGWMRWQLMDDQTLRTMFLGDQCGVCTDANWTVRQKNLPPP